MEELESASILNAGVEHDIRTFLDIFIETRDPSYKAFSFIWKQLHFSNIFNGFTTYTALFEFSEVLVNTVKRHALMGSEFSESPLYTFGAVYLLFGVYKKQPVQYFAKIRLTCDEVSKLEEVIVFCKKNNTEAEFCLCSLISSNAFYFVLTKVPMGPELKERLSGSRRLTEDLPEMSSAFKDFRKSALFTELVTSCKEYFQVREYVPEVYIRHQELLSFEKSSIPELGLNKLTEDLEGVAISSDDSGSTSDDDDVDIGERRRELKKIAMSASTTKSKSKALEETPHDIKNEDEEDDPDPTQERQRKRRVKRKGNVSAADDQLVTFETIGITQSTDGFVHKVGDVYYRRRKGNKRLEMVPTAKTSKPKLTNYLPGEEVFEHLKVFKQEVASEHDGSSEDEEVFEDEPMLKQEEAYEHNVEHENEVSEDERYLKQEMVFEVEASEDEAF